MPGVRDRVALVTGASRGIGLATARLLESQGARVMAVASERSERELASSGLRHYTVADLSTREGCRLVVDETVRCFGESRIDILVCNHGIGSANDHAVDDDNDHNDDFFRLSVETNLYGPYYLTKLVVPMMVRHKYGRCVYTSSTAATDEGAEKGAVGYNTSKSGLLGLMRSVCQDCGISGVTSNAVLPGWVRTEMAERSAAEEAKRRGITADRVWEERAALYPAKRVLAPDEVAHTILFLSSEESSGISGESIRVSLGCPW